MANNTQDRSAPIVGVLVAASACGLPDAVGGFDAASGPDADSDEVGRSDAGSSGPCDVQPGCDPAKAVFRGEFPLTAVFRSDRKKRCHFMIRSLTPQRLD